MEEEYIEFPQGHFIDLQEFHDIHDVMFCCIKHSIAEI